MKQTTQKSFLDRYWLIAGIFIALSFLIYGNSLGNEFAVIDDFQGYIQNESIRDIGKSISSLNLQQIIYSLNYAFFGINPLPLRILALINHSVVAVLIFFLISTVFNKKIAFLSALLFVAHPINTEVINWVSGQFYIVIAVFLYATLNLQLKYYETHNKKFLYGMAAIFFGAIITISHAWILIIPLASLILAYFFKPDKKKDVPFYTLFSILFIPLIVIFFIYQFGSAVQTRLADRTTTNERALTNQQKLKPVIEGYPYTVAEMTKLYLLPHTLTIYYDGKTISDWEYRSMFVIFFAYGFLIYIFFKKDKRICGLLLMLLVLLAPVFSPYKVTWFMTERYLYFGTGMFTTLLVLLFMYAEKKSSLKNLSVILTALVLVAYGIRSFSRNTEWKNPETLALATIQTAGASVRPYNDLAGYYVLQGRYDDAKRYYAQALTIQGSLTAMRNLGYIYLKQGIDDTVLTQTSAAELYDRAEAALNNQDTPYALFLYKESFNKDPQNSEVKKRIISLYIEGSQLEKAEDLIQTELIASPNDADLYYLLGYLSFQKGNKDEAIEYLNKTLSIDPRHSQAQTNLQMLMSSP